MGIPDVDFETILNALRILLRSALLAEDVSHRQGTDVAATRLQFAVEVDRLVRDCETRYGQQILTPCHLRWLIQQDGVSAIPKSGKREHIAANFAIFDFALSDAEMAEINKLRGGVKSVCRTTARTRYWITRTTRASGSTPAWADGIRPSRSCSDPMRSLPPYPLICSWSRR